MKEKTLAKVISHILGVAGVACLYPSVALAQENNGAKNLEEVIVTGSRIVRASKLDAGAQVVSMDLVQIENLSLQSTADVLRSSPLNSLGSFNERSGSSAQSNAYINLRGLSEERTLVLLNGRRMTGSPNAGASAININMIPMAAIGKVEIMADGGSAVYGSDAVAGVVNLYTREGFEGLEFNFSYGDRSKDDGTEEGLSVIAGGRGEKGGMFFAAEYSSRDPIWDRDREYTSPRATDTNGNGYIDAYSGETDGYSIYGRTISLYDPTTGFDQVLAANSCPDADGVWLGEVNADLDWGGPNTDTYCMYGYANASANKAGLDRVNMLFSGDYQISDAIQFYGSGLISQVRSFGRYAPPAATWADMPADYADVPFDIDALLADGSITDDYELTGYYRWTNVGTRDNEVTDLQIDFIGGFRGDITDNIKYDVYAQRSRYDSKEYGYYYLSILGLNYVMEQGIDPFSEEGAGAMSATTTQDNFTDMSKMYGHLQFNIGELFGAGDTYLLFGGEKFKTRYQNKYDRASENEFVGGSSGNSSSGEREVTALFAEAVLPVSAGVEVNAAIRFDDYSDFGSATSPSLSATWEATDSLTLRSRWSLGFRAPGLDQLYGPQTFSAEDGIDYLRCGFNGIAPADCQSTQIDTYYTTNDKLDAETSETFSVGANWKFTEGWSLDATYWTVAVDDVITQWTTQDLFYAEAAGVDLSQFQGLSVTRPTAGGRPSRVDSTYANAGELSVSGVDLQVSGIINTSFGVFSIDSLITEQLSYEEEGYPAGPNQDVTGFYLNPTTRFQIGLSWSYSNHGLGYVVDYLGPHAAANNVNPESFELEKSDKEYGSYMTMTAHYSYDFEEFGKVKIGVRNLTDKDPVLSPSGTFERDTYDLYDNTGRVLFAEYKIKL